MIEAVKLKDWFIFAFLLILFVTLCFSAVEFKKSSVKNESVIGCIVELLDVRDGWGIVRLDDGEKYLVSGDISVGGCVVTDTNNSYYRTE